MKESNAIDLTEFEKFLEGLVKVYEHEWERGLRSFENVTSKLGVILEIKHEFNLTLPRLYEFSDRLSKSFLLEYPYKKN